MEKRLTVKGIKERTYELEESVSGIDDKKSVLCIG